MKKYLIICGFGILIIVFLLHFSWAILPTSSSSHMLTLVRNGYPNPYRITLRTYVNNKCSNEYILDLKYGLYNNQPQKYKLPKVDGERVDVIIELEDGVIHDNNNIITIIYDNVEELYNKGLLIYLATDYTTNTYIGDFVYYDQYIHLVSGKGKKYYFEKAGFSEWYSTNKAPQPRKIVKKGMEYVPFYYKWKENVWITLTPEK